MEEATPEVAAQTTETNSENVLPSSYAWRRYFARVFDNSIVMSLIVAVLSFVTIVVLVFVNRQAAVAYIEWLRHPSLVIRFLSSVMTLCLWLPIEAFFLRVFGATPGKWIFGIQVRTQAGDVLDYRTALSRAGRVLVQGMGASIPIFSLIALIVSYDHLVKKGSTPWDDAEKTVVNYDKLTELRIVFCVIAVVLWAIATYISFRHFLNI